MEKAIIIGVYEFLGLHFCKKILEQGIAVEGIHIEIEDKELYIEEKKMEIGRNANFMENKLESIEEKESVCVIIDFYDFFVRNISIKFCSILAPYLEKMKKSKIILLLPIAAKREPFREEMEEVEKLMTDDLVVSSYYLPTVYGPWQPKEMVFQQLFLKEAGMIESVNVSSREWVYDALHVDEIIDFILEKNNSLRGRFLLTSGKENMWKLCAKELGFQYENKQEEPDVSLTDKIVVQSKLSYKEGLAGQKRNVLMLTNLL